MGQPLGRAPSVKPDADRRHGIMLALWLSGLLPWADRSHTWAHGACFAWCAFMHFPGLLRQP